MKFLHPFFLILIFTLNLDAQVFGTAQTLKSGKFSIGINPVIYSNGEDEEGIFGHVGLGLSPGLDLGFKLGLGLRDDTYLGLDLEWVLRHLSPYISISAGAHTWDDIGIDGTFNLTFPLSRQVKLYTGLDMDVIFRENNTDIPLWIPVGIDVALRKKMALLIEVEIKVNDDAVYNIFGAGVNFYL
jgi:hypothetical protein